MAKKILVLDIDKTMVYASEERTRKRKNHIHISYRPFLFKFLNKMKKHFNLVVFSAGSEDYVKAICEHIQKRNIYFKRIYDGKFLKTIRKKKKKDLRVISEDLTKILILDDRKKNFLKSQNLNAIIIKEFYGDKNDKIFSDITKIIEDIGKYEDVREGLKKNRRLLNKIMTNN